MATANTDRVELVQAGLISPFCLSIIDCLLTKLSVQRAIQTSPETFKSLGGVSARLNELPLWVPGEFIEGKGSKLLLQISDSIHWSKSPMASSNRGPWNSGSSPRPCQSTLFCFKLLTKRQCPVPHERHWGVRSEVSAGPGSRYKQQVNHGLILWNERGFPFRNLADWAHRKVDRLEFCTSTRPRGYPSS